MTKGINLMSAGGTRYTTQSTGGGDKKSGSVPRGTGFMLGSSTRTAVLGANGRGSGKPIPDAYKFPFLNQLSGIGRGRSMTTGNADGVNKKLVLKKVVDDIANHPDPKHAKSKNLIRLDAKGSGLIIYAFEAARSDS